MHQLSAQPWDRFLPHFDSGKLQYALGLFFIFCQCCTWISAAVLTQHIYEDHDSSPFLMTYVGMSLLALYLPLELWNRRRARMAKKLNASDAIAADGLTIDPATSFDSFAHDFKRAQSASCLVNIVSTRTMTMVNNRKNSEKRWNHSTHMLAALQIAPAMFIADWSFNSALQRTSVASATVLVSAQNMVVFLLAVLVRIERFSWIKLAGVILSVVGIALTALHDSNSEGNSEGNALLGDLFAVIAALMYGIYIVQVRLFCPESEELYNMALLLGYVGVFTICSVLPFAAYDACILRSSLTWAVFGFTVIKGILDFVLTDYFMFRAIVLTSATVATVGLGLTIPLAFITDCIFHPGDGVSVASVVGAVAVGAAFISVVSSPDEELKEEEQVDGPEDEPSSGFVQLPVLV